MRPEDWSGLAPERDRPERREFDWEPETLNLSEAASFLVKYHRRSAEGGTAYTVRYLSALVMWQALTGLGEAEALTWAYQIADAVPPVMGTAVPF